MNAFYLGPLLIRGCLRHWWQLVAKLVQIVIGIKQSSKTEVGWTQGMLVSEIGIY